MSGYCLECVRREIRDQFNEPDFIFFFSFDRSMRNFKWYFMRVSEWSCDFTWEIGLLQALTVLQNLQACCLHFSWVNKQTRQAHEQVVGRWIHRVFEENSSLCTLPSHWVLHPRQYLNNLVSNVFNTSPTTDSKFLANFSRKDFAISEMWHLIKNYTSHSHSLAYFKFCVALIFSLPSSVTLESESHSAK